MKGGKGTSSKVISAGEAVSRYVQDGMSLVLGTALEALIPFAAGFEIVRQGKKGLNLIGPISDILFDILIGAGCVSKVTAAWVGNVIAGSGYNLRRGLEEGWPVKLEMEDHTNFTIALGLKAAAMGLPFLPTRTALGSDLAAKNRNLLPFNCPFSREKLLAVKAIRPEVAIIHVQRADAQGNAHLWGAIGVTQEAVLASERTILTCEELVPPEVIRSDPNRTMILGLKVAAVVPLPGASLPSPTQGYWNRDHDFYLEYHRDSKTVEAFQAWLKEWVLDAGSHEGYLKLLGPDRLQRLKVKKDALAAPVNYGY